MDFDLDKERELDELHARLRKMEIEKKTLKDKLEQIEIAELKVKERINDLNDDSYVERKLQLLYDQKHEKKSGR